MSTSEAARKMTTARLAAWLLIAGAAAAQAPADSETPEARARRVLAEGACQTDLPGSAAAGDPGSASTPPLEPPPELPRGVAAAASGLATVVMYVFFGALVVGAIWLVTEAARDRRRARAAAKAPRASSIASGAAPTGPDAVGQPPDPDAAAVEGRFADALRLLLALASEAAVREGRLAMGAATTGREAAAAISGAPESCDAFRGLTAAVERAWFGGRAVAADEWRFWSERRGLLHAPPCGATS